MQKLFPIVKQVLSYLAIAYFFYYIYSLIFIKEDIYNCDSKNVESLIGTIVKKNDLDLFEKYTDTKITISEVQTLKKDSDIKRNECSSKVNILLKDKIFTTQIFFNVVELKKTDKPFYVQIRNYYPSVTDIISEYAAFVNKLEKEEILKRNLEDAKKLGFKDIKEYQEYQNFKLNDATYNERYKKVEALYEGLKLKFEQKQNLFKEKNFELTPNDYFDVIGVSYNDKLKDLEIKIRNKHKDSINDISIKIYTYDKNLFQKMRLSAYRYSKNIKPNETTTLTAENHDFSRYLDQEKKLNYFVDLSTIRMKDIYGTYSGKWDEKYGKSFIKNIEKLEDKTLLNDKEEIEKQMAFLKELDNKKLYYDEFFNQINKTKTPTTN